MLLFFITHRYIMTFIILLALGSILLPFVWKLGIEKWMNEMDKPEQVRAFLQKGAWEDGEECSVERIHEYLMSRRVAGISLRKSVRISRMLTLGAIVLCGVGVCIGIDRGETIGSLIPFYVISLAILYGYYSIRKEWRLNERVDMLAEKIAGELQKENDQTKIWGEMLTLMDGLF